ncbi:MAG: prolyl oligopeptidase family serine peptidase [Actinobacteria bacterium]|nr:prolyl oligopeptidase family serine peptidase [Actinomycetota bacterium]
MMRRVAAILALALSIGALAAMPARAATRWAGTFSKSTLPAGPAGVYPSRDYWTYVPPTLPPAGQRALVVYLHGCTQTGDDAARSVPWNDLADVRHFVVVYPEQSADPTTGDPARCWNTGQVAFPRGQGELESVAQITRAVMAAQSIDASRVYILGVSSGALMSNVMAATYPDLYRAMGSIEGCSYVCTDPTGDAAYMRMGPYARVMPVFVVQGTADYLTNPVMGEQTILQWLGTDDLADDGMHNQSVSVVPASYENRNLDSVSKVGSGGGDACLHDFPRNPCPLGALGVAPYPATVRHYNDSHGKEVLQAWLVHGLSHNYPGGTFEGSFGDPNGPDVTTAAFDFFEAANH